MTALGLMPVAKNRTLERLKYGIRDARLLRSPRRGSNLSLDLVHLLAQLFVPSLAVLAVVDPAMTVRANGSDPGRVIGSVVGKSSYVMWLEVRVAGVSLEWSFGPARLTTAG
jgi:hypothetical protein